MATSVKRIIKGFTYLQTMFDEKEPEMEIGFPTDVKHVAHIGGDGPANNKPSWMTEFNSAPELSSSQPQNNNNEAKSNVPPVKTKEVKQSSTDGDATSTEKSKHKLRRKCQSTGSDATLASPKGSEKPTRHRRATSNSSMDSEGGSPTRDSSNHRTRRHRHSKGTELPSTGNLKGVELLPPQDQPLIPKHSRNRKSKGTSKSKGQNFVSDISEFDS